MLAASAVRGRSVAALAASALRSRDVLPFAAPLLVILTLGLAVTSGLGRLPGGAQVLAMGIAGLAIAALVLRRLEWGVVLLPVVSVVVPFSVGTGTGSPIVASLAVSMLLIGMWILRMVVRGKIQVRRNAMNLPLVGFVAAALVSSVNAWVMLDPRVTVWDSFGSVQIGGAAMFLLSAGLYFLVANAFREARWLRWLVWTYLATSAGTLAIYFAQGRQDLTGSATQGLFSLWAISLALGLALFNQDLSRWVRAALLALAIGWLFRRFFLENDWVSGWLPAGLAVATIALLKSWRVFVGLLAVCLLVAALNFPLIGAFYEAQTAGSQAQGNSERLDIWSQNMQLTQDHLLLGTGIAGYALYYMSYFPNSARSSHSNYLDVFAQTGVLGTTLFALFWLMVLRSGLAARRSARTGFGAGYANAMVGATVGVLAAMALGDWVIPFVYNATIAGFRFTAHTWMFLGGLAALPYLEASRES